MRLLFACAWFGAILGSGFAQSLAGSYTFSTLAGRVGQSGATDGSSANARFNRPWGVATDGSGNVYVADAGNYTVRKITPAGVVSTLAGSAGTTGSLDGIGANAQFGALVSISTSTVVGPFALTVDAGGSVFVADSFSHTLRRITTGGVVSTFSGAAGATGSFDGPVASARYTSPLGVAIDANGNLYVADTYNHVIRRVNAAGVVTTIAGSVGVWGSADGIGNASRFLHPFAITVDPFGRVYVTDANNTVRRITSQNSFQTTWETTTIAGSPGTFGTADGAGAAARFGGTPTISTANPGSPTIRVVPGSAGITPALTGNSYAVGDLPGIAADASGNIFVSDYSNGTIRQISAAGVVTTIGGSSTFGSTDAIGTNARFSRPAGIAIDTRGNLYIADTFNQTIRKGTVITAPSIQTQPSSQSVGVGGTIALSVGASGVPDPTFLWSRNGVPISGATTATLTLSNAQPAQAGSYTVAVTNLAGVATSAAAAVAVVNTPTISVQPVSQHAASGDTVIFGVGVGGAPLPSVQWYRDGVAIPGATNLNLVLTNVQPASAGDYTVVATSSLGAVASNPARLVINSSRIVNLSIRTALSGNQPLIVGFVATGGSKLLLMRAIGPTLRSFGVTGAMADPLLSLHTAAGAVAATNDNWGSGPGVGQLTLASNEVGAFGLAADSLDAAVLATAVDSAMTLQAVSRTTAGGIVLIELYDAAPAAASRLINVSARTIVGAGENALFAGFVVAGNSPKSLLIRAVGPTLGAFGVPGVLNDPRLDVFANGATTALAANDNWGGNVALTAAFRAVGAFALPASESADAALLVMLQPGAYTAQVSGVGGLTGEVLLEIYEAP
jgi:sugar lactone lactonase YvrE